MFTLARVRVTVRNKCIIQKTCSKTILIKHKQFQQFDSITVQVMSFPDFEDLKTRYSKVLT